MFLIHVDTLVISFKTFFSSHMWFVPDIGDSNLTVELCTHACPSFPGYGLKAVETEIRLTL